MTAARIAATVVLRRVCGAVDPPVSDAEVGDGLEHYRPGRVAVDRYQPIAVRLRSVDQGSLIDHRHAPCVLAGGLDGDV